MHAGCASTLPGSGPERQRVTLVLFCRSPLPARLVNNSFRCGGVCVLVFCRRNSNRLPNQTEKASSEPEPLPDNERLRLGLRLLCLSICGFCYRRFHCAPEGVTFFVIGKLHDWWTGNLAPGG